MEEAKLGLGWQEMVEKVLEVRGTFLWDFSTQAGCLNLSTFCFLSSLSLSLSVSSVLPLSFLLLYPLSFFPFSSSLSSIHSLGDGEMRPKIISALELFSGQPEPRTVLGVS